MPAPTNAPLRWRSRTIEPVRTRQMRLLSKELAHAAAHGPSTTAPVLAKAAFDLPDLTVFPTPLDKAIRLLQAAAAVEHALMVQYLYAGYAFTSENRQILDVAIEEMSHLMTVQNLLKVIGGRPDLSRQDFGPPGSDEERLFPFDLLLEPVTHESLAKYVVAESPRDPPAGVDPALMERIVSVATAGAGGIPVNRVGTLYALLAAVFGNEQILLQQAATGDPWYVMVNALAAEAAAAYGGRDKLHLPDSAFQPASAPSQGSDADWDRSVVKANLDEFRVHVVGGRASALEALKDIGLQGEGPSTVATEVAHFMRFLNLFRQFYGADGTGTGAAPNAAPVPRATRILVDEQSVDPEAISHPDTARWARLADHRYAVLLGSLELYLRQPPLDRGFLLGWCFAEMFAIRKLSSFLTAKPRTSQTVPTVAALPFNLPLWAGRPVAWADLEGVFITATQEITAIQAAAGVTDAHRRLLGHLAASDLRKLAEVQARKAGGTVRRKSDRARDILDWAAGAADPYHDGDSPSFPEQDQGRFWNLPLNELKQTSVLGSNVVARPAPGVDAPLIRQLRLGTMPRNRPPLATTGDEFLFLEDWVNNGCPDDPV